MIDSQKYLSGRDIYCAQRLFQKILKGKMFRIENNRNGITYYLPLHYRLALLAPNSRRHMLHWTVKIKRPGEQKASVWG